ncbi:MAG: ABC transporter ATP-binding protein/permease [candidate division WOR-3 bacterium]|nr:ABC transporter ATP-binding protein/permease [candidate division WOR-3 bacterium]
MFNSELFLESEGPQRKKYATKSLVKFLLPYFRRFSTKIILSLFLLLVTTGLGVLSPLLLKRAIDVNLPQKDLRGLFYTTLVYLFLQVIIFVLNYRQRLLLGYVGEEATALIKENLYNHILRLPMKFFDKNPPGRLITRIDSDAEAIKNLFTNTAVVLVQDLVLLIGMLIVMAVVNYKLFLVVFLILPPFVYAFSWFERHVRAVYLEIRKRVAEINNFLNETIQNLLVLQAFLKKNYAYSKMAQLNYEKYKKELEGMSLWYRIWFLVDFGEVLGLVLVLGIGGLWALNGYITIGTLFLFANYITRLFMPIRGLSDQLNVIERAMASTERIYEISLLESEPNALQILVSPRTAFPKIVFENVYLHYQDKNPENPDWVLENINFYVNEGEKIALVGLTGSGKTSIVSLLLKFYTPQKGRILLDGIDIKELNNTTLRRRIGYVPQDIVLFPGTVLDNIRLFDSTISFEKIATAVQLMGIEENILRLPQGYNTDLIQAGINLSLGERQLLSFVRALVRDPEILILDEATSSIDPHTEHLIQEGLQKLLYGRTAIVIAHRLATIQKLSRLIVLHRGKIVEEGTHNELLSRRGHYYRLYRLQFLSKEGVS